MHDLWWREPVCYICLFGFMYHRAQGWRFCESVMGVFVFGQGESWDKGKEWGGSGYKRFERDSSI